MHQTYLARFFQYSHEIMDSVDGGMYTVDLNLKITSINHAAAEAAGVLREEALGRHCYELFHMDLCASGCPVGGFAGRDVGSAQGRPRHLS